MRRTNVYFTEKQLERLHAQAEREGVALAEVIRRAIEVYLAWNDPTYAPRPLRVAQRDKEDRGRGPTTRFEEALLSLIRKGRANPNRAAKK